MIKIRFFKLQKLIGRKNQLNLFNQKLFSTNNKSSFNYDIVHPQSYNLVKRKFTDDIKLPSYAISDNEVMNDDHLFDKFSNYKDLSRDDDVINGVRHASLIAKKILKNTKEFIKPNMSGEEIDDFVYKQCLNFKCYPSPFLYNHFPKCFTLSINNIVIHGIPDHRLIKISDIVKVDISIYFNGYHADNAQTFLITHDKAIDYQELNSSLITSNVIDENGLKLIKTAKKCLDEGIKVCKAGIKLNEIGYIIDKIARENGFNVVPAVCGHSIGEYLHGDPHIVHCVYDDYFEGEDFLLENMLITIEPVICEFEPDVELLEDGFTVSTEDGGRTAQFEHTILVKKTHSEILT